VVAKWQGKVEAFGPEVQRILREERADSELQKVGSEAIMSGIAQGTPRTASPPPPD
jgi:hypothetical protein